MITLLVFRDPTPISEANPVQRAVFIDKAKAAPELLAYVSTLRKQEATFNGILPVQALERFAAQVREILQGPDGLSSYFEIVIDG